MTKKFLERVRREFIVDTKIYRYAVKPGSNQIHRIRLEYLNTTAAYTEWEVVA